MNAHVTRLQSASHIATTHPRSIQLFLTFSATNCQLFPLFQHAPSVPTDATSLVRTAQMHHKRKKKKKGRWDHDHDGVGDCRVCLSKQPLLYPTPILALRCLWLVVVTDPNDKNTNTSTDTDTNTNTNTKTNTRANKSTTKPPTTKPPTTKPPNKQGTRKPKHDT
eukprot:2772918-Rhodomonas_salina.1